MTAEQFGKRLAKLANDAAESGVDPMEVIKFLEMTKLAIFVDCHARVRGEQIKKNIESIIKGN